MNTKLIGTLAAFTCVVAILLVPFPDGFVGVAATSALAAGLIFLFRRYTDEKQFITNAFILGLALRIGFGVVIHVFELRDFFGGDAFIYDRAASTLLDVWIGNSDQYTDLALRQTDASTVGWGMYYFVAGMYYIFGKNIFAAQCVCAVIGAAAVPMGYFCSSAIYDNKRVAKAAAVTIAVFPAFVVWSGQLLKDGIIIFLLVVTMTMVMRLQRRIGYKEILVLAVALACIFSLRFYIFYPVVVSIGGSFFIGMAQSMKSLIQRGIVVLVVGLAMSFLGINRAVSERLESFGGLERLQNSRLDQSRAGSGYNEDADVSTTSGALAALPLGFAYLMFAPFPWDAANLRQAITIPEVLLWWAMIPFAISGLIYTARFKLRAALPVLTFSALLTLLYSVSQGNVGTAYRQRTQIQIFLFMFIAVGWVLMRERMENKKLLNKAVQQRMYDRLREPHAAS